MIEQIAKDLFSGDWFPKEFFTKDLVGAQRSIRLHLVVGLAVVLVLKDGRMQTFGPKEAVLAQVLQRAAPPVPTPIKIVADAGAAKS